MASIVRLSLFMHVHPRPLSLAARVHQCHTNCSHYINNGWTFFRLNSYILRFQGGICKVHCLSFFKACGGGLYNAVWCVPLCPVSLCILLKICLLCVLLLERGEGKKRGTETSMWETLISCLLSTPQPETELTTQARALTRNQTGNRFALWDNAQSSHTGQGSLYIHNLIISFLNSRPISLFA